MASLALLPRAQESFSQTAAEAIRVLQERSRKTAAERDEIRAEARRMREMLVEMQTALQKAVEENSSSRGAAEKAAQLERQVASLSAEKGRAEERCREQEKEIEALTARLREADSLACLARGEAQASLAEAATLRDAIQRNVVEMEQARETTSHALRRANGERALRRDVLQKLERAEQTLRCVLSFSSSLVDAMTDTVLRTHPTVPSLENVGLASATALLQPVLRVGEGDSLASVARLGGVQRVQRSLPSTRGATLRPAPGHLRAASRAHRDGCGDPRLRAAKEVGAPETRAQVLGVLGSLEDELAVLDSKYAGLLADAEALTERMKSGDGGDDAQLSADKEELDRAMEATKSAIQAKGRQIQQLEAYLAVL